MKTIPLLASLLLVPFLGLAKEKEKAAVPDASLSDVTWGQLVNDAPFDKDKLKGKVVVVEKWGVNCAPCIASLPELAKMAKSGEKKGLVVVGLESQGSAKEAILKVLDAAKVKYPVMAGGSAPNSPGTIPYACVFNAEGKLVWNGNPHDEDFERAVKKALREVKDEAKG